MSTQETGALLLALTAGDTVPDVPPGGEIDRDNRGVWVVRFGSEWDYHFSGETREDARSECWRQFCEAEPEWAELLARLLSVDPVWRASRTMVRLLG